MGDFGHRPFRVGAAHHGHGEIQLAQQSGLLPHDAQPVVPVLILVTIAVPSFRLLFFQLNVPKADVTLKATGKQWFWSYSYPDSKFEFDSLLA